jgi:hypothetical protein
MSHVSGLYRHEKHQLGSPRGWGRRRTRRKLVTRRQRGGSAIRGPAVYRAPSWSHRPHPLLLDDGTTLGEPRVRGWQTRLVRDRLTEADWEQRAYIYALLDLESDYGLVEWDGFKS